MTELYFVQLESTICLKQKESMQWKVLSFWFKKKCGHIKARTCANGSTQRQYITKDEATSPTVSHEVTIITGVIEAKQQCDIMTTDIPNAFVQTDIDQSGEKIIMKIRGELVDILVEESPKIYSTMLSKKKVRAYFMFKC